MSDSNKGSTLVEIMVVVMIVGIVAAVAIPGIAKSYLGHPAEWISEDLRKGTAYKIHGQQFVAGETNYVVISRINRHSGKVFEPVKLYSLDAPLLQTEGMSCFVVDDEKKELLHFFTCPQQKGEMEEQTS